tara:strand:- start:85 stop:732 length:648 start_codon:yes stop_codon:yes gene_type:complete
MATQTLKVPNKLSEITLGQYQQFSKISTDDAEEDFLQKKTIEIFCGVDLKDVNTFKYSSIIKVIQIINKMFNQKPSLTQRFKYKKYEFGFIPKLDDMSFGEYVDLDTLMSDWETMHEAMAVLFRKIENKTKNDYTIVDYNINETEDMKQMPLDVALGAIFFLDSLKTELYNHILNYLKTESKKIKTEQKQHLQKIMDGGFHFTPLVKETSQNLSK